MAKHGGPRPGSGRPKGPSAGTISKIEAREMLRRIVMSHLDEMVAAQIANSKGLKYLVVRDKRTGKFVRMTEAMAKELQGKGVSEHENVEIWEKDPSVQAFSDLLNRALDKPAEQEQQLAVTGTLSVKWEGE